MSHGAHSSNKPLDYVPGRLSLFLPIPPCILGKLRQEGEVRWQDDYATASWRAGKHAASSRRGASPTSARSGAACTSGYRKNKSGGVWTVRRYIDGAYVEARIALADDREDANGDSILDFYQAQDSARNMRPSSSKRGAYVVKDAVRDYLSHLEGRASHYDAKCRLGAYATHAFGDTAVADLTADELRAWHRGIAKQGARRRTKRNTKQVYGSVDTTEAARGRQASANRCLSLLKAALNHAWREGKCELGALATGEAVQGCGRAAPALPHGR